MSFGFGVSCEWVGWFQDNVENFLLRMPVTFVCTNKRSKRIAAKSFSGEKMGCLLLIVSHDFIGK
jgi:hypothetical protein